MHVIYSFSDRRYAEIKINKMATPFAIPTGPPGDTAELEFISALHQTDPTCIRKDGSIKGKSASEKNHNVMSFM